MVAWSVELSEFDIKFETRGLIKSQALADFIVELTPTSKKEIWILYVDGSSNTKGSEVGIGLEIPMGIIAKQALRFKFQAKNTKAE